MRSKPRTKKAKREGEFDIHVSYSEQTALKNKRSVSAKVLPDSQNRSLLDLKDNSLCSSLDSIREQTENELKLKYEGVYISYTRFLGKLIDDEIKKRKEGIAEPETEK